jgi:hypothetical protein
MAGRVNVMKGWDPSCDDSFIIKLSDHGDARWSDGSDGSDGKGKSQITTKQKGKKREGEL